jgi:LemA protein
MTSLYLLLGLLALLLVWVITTYNALVKSRNKVDEAWSGVDVQLKRRHDLVPNLVETVKGYAAHERRTLELVTNARAAAIRAVDEADVGRAESALSAALGDVRALAEAYPELRAAKAFQALQAQLAEIEDEIQAARRIYNANVQHFNTLIQTVPNNLVAGPFSFALRDFFQIELPAERTAPAVAI